MTIKVNGIERELSLQEAIQRRLFQDAMQGRRLSQREVVKWIIKREKAIPTRKKATGALRVKTEADDPSNIDDALVILGIATKYERAGHTDDRRPLLLEPWAVQQALSRRTGAELAEDDVSEIKRCTRTPAAVRWPRSMAK